MTPKRFISVFIFISLLSTNYFAFSAEKKDDSDFNMGEMIMHHVLDDYQYEVFHGLIIPLPIILYTEEKGLMSFSSSNLFDDNHNPLPMGYNGFIYDHGKLKSVDKSLFFVDLSITKNVAFLIMTSLLMVLIFISVARGYSVKNSVPKGIQSVFEPLILFVRDDIVKPNIGHNYEKYLPYMLTLFFFIFFGNVLGLLPAAANLTGNIAVTMTLAIFTFLITNFSGNKNYWKHIFWTPGIPLIMRVIILPIELIGVFSKPISLMIRLFAAITAGHIVLLSFIGLIFIFQSYGVGIFSSLFVVGLNLVELMVAGIQAYVFTMFSSVYIGLAIEDDH
ncbi:MAG: ATP synthase F0 subunit A [Cytophagia bacterium]|jgi:F-type H+-transporting ATPase subunit a|nr:ATP synthase F0 subunit A [Cytophagia bacterium]|tara:strand:+ start:4138 stop:5139 length:1002 start_codon:yes stop_codon:yes gene_type:complete